MAATSSVSVANCFIDLATFSELESFLYGGPLAISFFVAGVQKANWFSIIPIALRNNGIFSLGQEGVSSSLNRSGDYVLNLWFRCEFPTLAPVVAKLAADTCRWTRNLMHNIIKRCTISFNELIVQEFDNYWLDFNYMFRIPASKRVGYKQMIGDVQTMTTSFDPTGTVATVSGGLTRGIYGGYFSVVLPFWFGEDSGVALPVAALPFNDIKINYEFRNATDLLVLRGTQTIANLASLQPGADATTGLPSASVIFPDGAPNFRNANTFAHYAVIHNDERTKMGDSPRDMLIRQIQTVADTEVPVSATTLSVDLRISHSVVSLFFAMRNKSQPAEWSNYTTNFDQGVVFGPSAPVAQGGVGNERFHDPIANTRLSYENTARLDQNSDFFSKVHPYLYSEAVPDEPGYHMWTYSIKPWEALSPAGSTNFSKLANATMTHDISNLARYWMNHPLTGLGIPLKLTSIFIAQNWNIARAANGSIGHPTL